MPLSGRTGTSRAKTDAPLEGLAEEACQVGRFEALRRVLRTERLDRSAVLYVGDEVRDVEAARKAGVAVAAVTWGFHAEPILRASDPDHVVTEPRQLLELLSGVRAAG